MKPIRKGTPVFTCYRNTSSVGTASQLIREREMLRRMFICSCCLCMGACGVSGPIERLGPAVPSSLLDPEVLVPVGSDTDLKPAAETAKQLFHQECHQDSNTGGPKISACVWPNAPDEDMPPPTAILPTPRQLKWNLSANKRKHSRLNKLTQRSRPSDPARSRKDSFSSHPGQPTPASGLTGSGTPPSIPRRSHRGTS